MAGAVSVWLWSRPLPDTESGYMVIEPKAASHFAYSWLDRSARNQNSDSPTPTASDELWMEEVRRVRTDDDPNERDYVVSVALECGVRNFWIVYSDNSLTGSTPYLLTEQIYAPLSKLSRTAKECLSKKSPGVVSLGYDDDIDLTPMPTCLREYTASFCKHLDAAVS